MNYEKRHKHIKIIFGVIGILIIPIYAMLFARIGPDGDLIIVTFSQIGSRYGGIEGLIIWGILTSVYYFCFIEYIAIITKTSNFFVKLAISIGCISLLVSVFLPFAPSMFPIASETHNFLAYVTGYAVISSLIIFVWTFRLIDKTFFLKSAIFLFIGVGISLYVFINYGVSSLFQIILTTTLCLFLYIVLIMLEKCKKIDIILSLKEHYESKIEEFDLY